MFENSFLSTNAIQININKKNPISIMNKIILNPQTIIINNDGSAQTLSVVKATNENRAEFVRINNDLPREVAEAIFDTICQPTLGMAVVLTTVCEKNPQLTITDTVAKHVSSLNTILEVLDENLTMIITAKNWENLKKQLPIILENALVPFQNEPARTQNNMYSKITRRFFNTLAVVKKEIFLGNFTDKYIAKKIGTLINLFNTTKAVLDFITTCTTVDQVNEAITMMKNTLEAYQNVPEFQNVFIGEITPFNGYKVYTDMLIDTMKREKNQLTTTVLERTAEVMFHFYGIISTYNTKVAEVKWTVGTTATTA